MTCLAFRSILQYMTMLSQHSVFLLSIFLKGFFALMECLTGATLFFVSTEQFQKWGDYLVQNELVADPQDFIANQVHHFVHGTAMGGKRFAGFYLFAHGFVKILIVLGLLSEKRWAFPMGLSALGLFVIYQLTRFAITHAIGLVIISGFDGFVMLMIYREWRVKAGS